jgi:hypothetical protein
MKRFTLLAAALTVAVASGLAVLAVSSSVAASSLPTLTLAVTKNNVVVGGSKVSGAVNVVSTVSGEPSDGPGLILLKPGVSAAKFKKVTASLGKDTPLDAIDPYATIVFDAQLTSKGNPTTDQVDLQPGNYIAVNNGNAFTPFTVMRSAHPATLPTPGATVTAIDFAFRGASTLHAGALVRFENDGYLIHMVLSGGLKSPADAKPVDALLLAGKVGGGAGKKYLVSMGQFAGPLSHGSMQQEVITQAPGTYVILCAMNAEDGRDHYQLGMFRTITIVK